MATTIPFPFFHLLILASVSSPLADDRSLSTCISEATGLPFPNASQLLHTPETSSYASILLQSMQNLRFSSPTASKPALIVAPTYDSHVRAAVACCRSLGAAVRVRSGGHDYQGLSYRSDGKGGPFAVIDLGRMREIRVDVAGGTAWVDAGATLGWQPSPVTVSK